MIVRRFFEPLIAQASYLIGCGATGQAIVIDPNRDSDTYVQAAAADHLTITHVTETHIHADFLSGSRQLARRTGAELLLSDEGDENWKYAFASEGRLVRDGDRITIGSVLIDVVHTPGHTPEHLTLVVTDGAVADQPIAAATGDFIFVGDVGRPDLLERAANFAGTMEAGARTLYRSLQAFNHHEEWLQIWPGHGAGSSCGKGISAVPYSTLGYERRFNWAFKVKDETEFVHKVLTGQPDPPTYFAVMKRMNKVGPPILADGFSAPRRLPDEELSPLVAGGALVVDTRSAAEYGARSLPGTINLPLTPSFVTYGGWLLPYDADLYLLIGDGAESRLPEIARGFALIGLDRIAGYFADTALHGVASPQTIRQLEPTDLVALNGQSAPVVIDVRQANEWNAGHLSGAMHIPLGRLESRVSEIPKGRPLAMQCQGGTRSAIAASLLKRAGFADVSNLAGGMEA